MSFSESSDHGILIWLTSLTELIKTLNKPSKILSKDFIFIMNICNLHVYVAFVSVIGHMKSKISSKCHGLELRYLLEKQFLVPTTTFTGQITPVLELAIE